MHHPREIELKLEVLPEHVKALRSAVLSLATHRGETRRLVSVYYDSAERDLRAAGVSLRVRVGDGEATQTVKMARGPGVGLFDRSEWETPLGDQRPDLDALGRTPAATRLDIPQLRLEPLFETRIDRTRWRIAVAESTVEVALDTGRVVANGRRERLAELELELKEGEPRDLFRLMAELDGAAGLKPGVQTKSDRGYRLAAGKRPRPVKAEPVHIRAGMTTAEAFQAIAAASLRHFGLNEALVASHRSPAALHQARVALRRLRSALSLFKDMVGDPALRALKTDLQALSRDLGDARNLDVYLARGAQPDAGRAADEPDVAAFLRELETRRSAAYDRVIDRLRSPDFRRLMLRLVEWLQFGAWLSDEDPLRQALRERPAAETAAAMLDRQRRKVKRRGRRLAALDPPTRHRVRIEAKKLRYAAEFFAGLATTGKAARRHAAFVSALEGLQGHLGDLNDIETGHEIAASFAAVPGAPHVPVPGVFAAAHRSGLRDAEVEALLRSAVVAHATLCDTKRFWKDWD